MSSVQLFSETVGEITVSASWHKPHHWHAPMQHFLETNGIPSRAYRTEAGEQSMIIAERKKPAGWINEREALEILTSRGGWTANRQRYGRAWINGKEYAWQGPSAGMYARFRAIKAKAK